MKYCLPKLLWLYNMYHQIVSRITPLLTSCALLFLRLIMAWEFLESGLEKLHGSNWFADIANKFPWPFRLLPVDLSWTMATYSELIGSILLLIGLGTRLSALSLIVVTYVAIHAVHWPDMWTTIGDLLKGYAIENEGHGNFKLPLLYLTMLFVLVALGGGRFSLDRLISRCCRTMQPPKN